MSMENQTMGEINSLSTEDFANSDLGSATDFQETEVQNEGTEPEANLQDGQEVPEGEDGLTPDGQEEAEVFQDEKKETAFSKRLAKEREKQAKLIRAELEAEYSRYKKLAKIGAEQNGMSEQQYLQALEGLEKEAQKEKYGNLSEEEIEALEWAKENKSKVEEAKRFNEDLAKLSKTLGKKISPDSISNEAYELYFNHNVPLEKAYSLVQGNNINKTQIEQEAIKKLKQNAASSVGSLGQAGEEAPLDFSKMSKKDFESYKERVKRGERIRA